MDWQHGRAAAGHSVNPNLSALARFLFLPAQPLYSAFITCRLLRAQCRHAATPLVGTTVPPAPHPPPPPGGRTALCPLPACRMEEAFQQAIERLGGLEAAKPKAILELLAAEFPSLTTLVRASSLEGCSCRCRRCRCCHAGQMQPCASEPQPGAAMRLLGCCAQPTAAAAAACLPPNWLQQVSAHLAHHRVRLARLAHGDGAAALPATPTKWVGRQAGPSAAFRRACCSTAQEPAHAGMGRQHCSPATYPETTPACHAPPCRLQAGGGV